MSATYAWFQLSQDKQIEVSGTSFGKSEDLTFGFVSDVPLTYDGITYSAEDSALEGKNIYWCDTNIASSDLVKYIISENGYSSGTMFPVTSGKYEVGDSDFSLSDAPYYGCTYDSYNKAADKTSYYHVSFAFKVKGGANSTSNDPVNGAKVYMSDYQISGTSKDAVRMHLSSNTITNSESSSIIRPTSSSSGSTYVGGALDLDQDGEFDYAYSSTDKKLHEIFYGQNDSDISYKEAYADTVNTTSKNLDCFTNPNHREGVLPLGDVSSFASRADYSSLDSYLYKGNGADNSNVTPMCTTDVNGIGFLDMDIYMEGWDHSLINQEIGSTIGTSIAFANGVDE